MPKIIENVRERIIEKAYNLFILEGYDQVNTSRIARECKIASGTLFNYFPTKWELLIEILKRVKLCSIGYFLEMLDGCEDEDEKTENLIKGMYFIIERIGRLDKKFYVYILSQDEKTITKLKKEDEEDELAMINLYKQCYHQLSGRDEKTIRFLMRSINALVFSHYSSDEKKQPERIKYTKWAIHSLLNNLDNYIEHKQEDK